MNNQLNYKMGALIFGVSTLAIVLVILSQYADIKAPREDQQMVLEDELRMHRQVLLDIKNSNDPDVKPEIKHECDKGINEINNVLYRDSDEKLTEEEETRMRIRLHEISEMIMKEYGRDRVYSEETY